MTSHTDLERTFRSAWLDASGNDFASRMARKSLEASARQDPHLSTVLFELKNKYQAELDLHINGDTVVGHEADAERYTEFVRGIVDAVKAVTKRTLGRERRIGGLLIVAPQPGSIRVLMRAAAPAEVDGAIANARSETVDSDSLRTVANLLARAGSSGGSQEVLTGLVSQLPPKARTGIHRTAYAAVHAHWDFTGELRRPAAQSIEINVSNVAARTLLEVLEAKEVSTEKVTMTGRVDGQRRSIAAMWFDSDSNEPVEAAVANPQMLDVVADLAASGDLAVAQFEVVTKVSKAGQTTTRSYVLAEIHKAANASSDS